MLLNSPFQHLAFDVRHLELELQYKFYAWLVENNVYQVFGVRMKFISIKKCSMSSMRITTCDSMVQCTCVQDEVVNGMGYTIFIRKQLKFNTRLPAYNQVVSYTVQPSPKGVYDFFSFSCSLQADHFRKSMVMHEKHETSFQDFV